MNENTAAAVRARNEAYRRSHTPAPWTAYRMVHEETGEPMTPEQIGEYVCNAVKKSFEASGTYDFLIVSATHEDGRPADVCHIGNGAHGPANAHLIQSAPKLLAALKSVVAIAKETFAEWDADNDMRVGKILIALSGRRKYRADIDAIHDAIDAAEGL